MGAMRVLPPQLGFLKNAVLDHTWLSRDCFISGFYIFFPVQNRPGGNLFEGAYIERLSLRLCMWYKFEYLRWGPFLRAMASLSPVLHTLFQRGGVW